jgi:hypothetical protein
VEGAPRAYISAKHLLAMLSERFVTAIRAQPKSANTAVAKDVGIYVHTLNPSHTVKASFKKSSAPVNALAVNSTHIFSAQLDKAVVHVYSRERGNQEALVSFPERISCLALAGESVLVIGTIEGRILLWEVNHFHVIYYLQSDKIIDFHRSDDIDAVCTSPISNLYYGNKTEYSDRIRRLEHTCLVTP